MTTDTKTYDIVSHTISGFAKELEERIMDGWAISPTNRGDVIGVYGGTYTISLYRNNETIQRLQSRVGGVQEDPKPSRGEILAKARQAKAERKVNTQD